MEERLKRRLVGAVVLVLAVVIFVPMFLGTPHELHVETSMAGGDSASEDPDKDPPDKDPPDKDPEDEGDTPTVSRPAETVSIVRIASDGTVKHESTSAALEAVDPDKKTQPATPSAEDDAKSAVEDDRSGASDQASVADTLADRSQATPKPKASDETPKADTPETAAAPDKASSDEPSKSEAAKSESSEGDRTASASATEIIDSPGGWVVQVGSFSDAKNAETLKEKFRKNGYRVFTVSGRNASDNTKMTRVFVGSEESREKAEVLKKRIEDDRRVGTTKGLVRPWPDEAQEGQ